MDDTAEAIAYQNVIMDHGYAFGHALKSLIQEIDEMLGGLISAEDEEEIQKELDELQEQEVCDSLLDTVLLVLLTFVFNFSSMPDYLMYQSTNSLNKSVLISLIKFQMFQLTYQASQAKRKKVGYIYGNCVSTKY